MRHLRLAGPGAAIIAYLAILMAVLGPSMGSVNALGGGDWVDLLYPFHGFTRDVFARDGRLPFWNPYIFSGQPHLVSLNVLALYPTELLSLFTRLETHAFYALDLMVHLLIAGAGMFWWLRRSGRSLSAAFIGGLSYMLGGHLFTLAAAGHPHWVRCLAWLPFVFALLEGNGCGLARYACAGSLLALAVLTSAMQFVACALPVCAGWILLIGSGEAERGRTLTAKLGKRLVRLAVFVGAMAGLGAVVLVPGLEYYAQSVRATAGADLASQWALSFWDLPAFLLPELWGDTQAYFGPHLFRSSTDYPGLLPLSLAAVGALAALRNSSRWVVLAFVGVLLSFGPATPVGALLAKAPVFSGFRTPMRWLSFVHLAGCVLVARGWDEAVGERKRSALVATGLLAAFAVSCWVMASRSSELAGAVSRADFVAGHLSEGRVAPREVKDMMRAAFVKGSVSAATTAGALGLLVALPGPFWMRAAAAWGVTAADLAISCGRYFIFAPAASWRDADPVARFMLDHGGRRGGGGAGALPFRIATDEYFGLPNRRMRLGLEWTNGYHGLPLWRYMRLYSSAVSASSMSQLSLLNVRYLVTTGPPVPGLKLLTVLRMGDGKVAIEELPAVLPRAFLAGSVTGCTSFECVMSEINKPGWTPVKMPTDSRLDLGFARGRLATAGSITCSYDRDSIDATVSLKGDGSGLVVFSEVWYPAWKAFVDGARVPLIRAYGALRAIVVPPGSHAVRMTYDSWCFKMGLWVSFATAAGLLAFAAARALEPVL